MLINKFVCKPSHRGTGLRFEGHLDLDDKGRKVVVQDPKTNLKAIIQSYADSCKIENIVARLQCGDYAVLIGSRGEGNYIDEETGKALATKDIVEINKDLTATYQKLYSEFPGKDNISYKDYVSLLSTGKYSELQKFIAKKEVTDNA